MATQVLRERILQLRIQAIDSRHFIPTVTLHRIFSDELLRSVLSESNFCEYCQQELLDCTLNGGKRVVAALIMCHQLPKLGDFIDHDQLRLYPLDSGLPFEQQFLKRIFADDSGWREFDKWQWEFCAPVLGNGRFHGVLPDDTILPFVGEIFIRKGHCGGISKTLVHESHLRGRGGRCAEGIGADAVVLFRKDFTQRFSYVFENEERTLVLLQTLRHPNIVEIVASYTFRGHHSLLFPPAEGSLSELFRKERTSAFGEDLAFYRALYGLSSAIESLHNFRHPDNSMPSMIGSHFDLKPDNILVDKEEFLLADFGISKLVGESTETLTRFRWPANDYVAPECETILEASIQPGMVGRSSDIWSLGCIIAETITYMVHGPHGLIEFFNRRKKTLHGYITVYRFHHGLSACAEVAGWLRELRFLARDDAMKKALDLVERMIVMDPNARPTAKEVMDSLWGICESESSSEHRCMSETVIAHPCRPRWELRGKNPSFVHQNGINFGTARSATILNGAV